MFVEKLELFGFKSFNKKTTVAFDKGISGVIGPNGCGKSNIVDAMRWVLGEQSSKQLRGAKMEDVIFNGTRHEKPLSLAQVELTVSNDRGLLPIEYSTVTVGRRLYRSGHSEYLINGNEVRLKDVRDLFLDTGMGSHAYSVIERHMVDNILSDTTGHRRFLFEEAAGIMKYKTRKKEALNKLEATDRDLTRVNDIISEVERQVGSLKRQVGKARKYRELMDSIQELDLGLSLIRRREWKQQLASFSESWESDSQVTEAAETKVSALEAQLEKLHLAVLEEERKLSAAREQLAQVEDELGRSNNRLTAVRERIQAAGQKIKESGEMQVRLQDRLERNARDREDASRRLAELQEREEREQAHLKSKDQERQATEVRFQNAQSNADASRREAARLTEHQVRSEAHAAGLRSRIGDLQERLQTLERDLEETAVKRDQAQKDLEAVGEDREARDRDLEAVQEAQGILHSEFENHRNRLELHRKETAHFREAEAAARSRLETLEGLQERYEGFGAGVRALVAGPDRAQGVVGTVSDLITVPAKWIRALEPVLANVWQYVVTGDTAAARNLLRRLESEDLGFAYLIPLDRVPESQAPGGEAVWASETVETAPEYRALVRHLLEGLALAPDADEAFRLVESGAAKWAVSPNGTFVDQTVLAGGGDGPQGSELLERQEGLERCRNEITAVSQELSRVSERERTLQEEEQHLEARQRELNQKESGLREAVQNLEHRKQAAALSLEHGEERSRRLSQDKQKTAAETETCAQELRNLETSLERLQSELTEARELETVHTQALVQATAERDGVLQDLHDIRVAWARLEGDLKDCRAGTERLETERKELDDELLRSRTEQEEAAQRKRDLETELQELGDRIQELHAVREERSQEVTRLEREKSEAVALEHQDSDAVRRARKEANEARSRAHQAELHLGQLRNDLEHLETRLREDYELAPEALDAMTVAAPPDNAAEELAVLRERLRRLGPVNHMALEEYEEKKTRFEFMSSQRDDLTEAKGVLVTTIHEINKKASVMFLDTFAEVQANFQKTFQVLFQGGECSLTLVGDDPLEADIDVVARPRGKRPQSINQLSSGERALTAIALLFAIYLVKPSPFCILDEVDAPLDDANIDRFVAMIKEFSKRTQFIMITHNKKTMEAADCLYGVTMQRPGVSSLVSVRLDGGNSPEADAALEGALQTRNEPALSAETTVA